jgi:CRP/FNR family transcriptional regulator/CRP/FNR family cyclic AMP-dependent transcriptional regulator
MRGSMAAISYITDRAGASFAGRRFAIAAAADYDNREFMSTTTDLLQRVPFLAALSSEDREELAASVLRRRYARGDIIFQREDPGQALFIVDRGSVRIYVPGAQGADLTLAVLGPGDFFGHLALLDDRPRSANALTLERADFLRLLAARPEAALAVLSEVSRRLRDTNEMASDLAFLDVGGRLAKKLLDLAAINGVPRRDGILVDILLTQEELANMIGVTRESVNRNLSLFRRLGMIGREGRRLVLLDPAALRRRCE